MENSLGLSLLCSMCSKRYLTMQKLRRHMATNTVVRSFKCDICEKAYFKKSALKTHHFTTHVGTEKKISCSFCTKKFMHRSQLEVHLRSHTNERPYNCKKCMVAYTSSTCLATHMRTHITATGQPYACPKCGKYFATRHTRNQHLNRHEYPYKHICVFCSRSFRITCDLHYHLRRHINKKPYPYFFVRKGSLALTGI